MSLSKVYVQNVMHAKLDIEVVISRVPCSLARPGHVLPPARLIILPGKSRAAAVRTRMRRADRLSMSVYRG
jgi:cob(I)alamin adenosyltransferase